MKSISEILNKNKTILQEAYFTFGKYKGYQIDEVPDDYLKWVLKNIIYKTGEYEYLEDELLKALGYESKEDFINSETTRTNQWFGQENEDYTRIIKITNINKKTYPGGSTYFSYFGKAEKGFSVSFYSKVGLGFKTNHYYKIIFTVVDHITIGDKNYTLIVPKDVAGESTRGEYKNQDSVKIYVPPPSPPKPKPKPEAKFTANDISKGDKVLIKKNAEELNVYSNWVDSMNWILGTTVEVHAVYSNYFTEASKGYNLDYPTIEKIVEKKVSKEEPKKKQPEEPTYKRPIDLSKLPTATNLIISFAKYNRNRSETEKEQVLKKYYELKNEKAIHTLPFFENWGTPFIQNQALDYLIKLNAYEEIFSAGLEEESKINFWEGSWEYFDYDKALSALETKNTSYYNKALSEWPSRYTIPYQEKPKEYDFSFLENHQRILELSGLDTKLLNEAISSSRYIIPRDREQIMWDFYALMAAPTGKLSLTHRGDKLEFIYAETVNRIANYLRKHLLNAVYFALCAEIRHMFDSNSKSSLRAWFKKIGMFSFYTKYTDAYYYKPKATKKGIPIGKARHKEDAESYRKSYRATLYTKYPREEIVEMMENAFVELHWSPSYGGQPWSNIANGWLRLHDTFEISKYGGGYEPFEYPTTGGVHQPEEYPDEIMKTEAQLYYTPGEAIRYPEPKATVGAEIPPEEPEKIKEREPLPITVAIDRIYDLQHNTNTVFNKIKEYYKPDFGGYGWIVYALDYKANEKNPWMIIKKSSPFVKNLTTAIMKASGLGDWESIYKRTQKGAYGPYNVEIEDFIKLNKSANLIDHLQFIKTPTGKTQQKPYADYFNGAIVKVISKPSFNYAVGVKLVAPPKEHADIESGPTAIVGYETITDKLTEKEANSLSKEIQKHKEEALAKKKEKMSKFEKLKLETPFNSDNVELLSKVKLKDNLAELIPEAEYPNTLEKLNGKEVGVYTKDNPNNFKVKINTDDFSLSNIYIPYYAIEKITSSPKDTTHSKGNINIGDKVLIKEGAKDLDYVVWDLDGGMDWLEGSTVKVVEKLPKNLHVTKLEGGKVYRIGYVSVQQVIKEEEESLRRIAELAGVLNEEKWSRWEKWAQEDDEEEKWKDFDWEDWWENKVSYSKKPKKVEYHRVKEIPVGLPGKLYTHRMPYYHEEIPEQWEDKNITTVVSLLEPKFYNEDFYKKRGVNYYNFPITDFSIPSYEEAKKTVHTIYKRLKAGENVSVHCFGGHGRTGLIVAILYSLLNKKPTKQAIEEIRKIDPGFVETKEQERFVNKFVYTYVANRKKQK